MNKSRLFRRADADIMFYGLAAAYILSCFARRSWFAELATHFMLQYAVASVVIGAWLYRVRASRWKLIAAALLGLLCWLPVVSLLLPRSVARADTFEDITILQFNVNFTNSKGKEIVQWISNYPAKPDIILFQELSDKFAQTLGPLEKDYPYRLMEPKLDAFGVAILSRLPMEGVHRAPFPGIQNKYSQARLRTLARGIPFALTELHAMSPIGPVNAAERNAELSYVAGVAAHAPEESKILIGDMNVTPYSPYFRELEKNAGLTSVMRGKGIGGTWPSDLPMLLRLPIDQMFVSSNIEVLDRMVEHAPGSDHLPVVTKLRIYAAH